MKLGLVLEGGGLRGAYTAGVLSWLIREGIEVDITVGISSGALHACHYLMKDVKALHGTSVDFASDLHNVGLIPLLHEGQPVGYDFLFEGVLKHELKFDVAKLKSVPQVVEFGVYSLEKCETFWMSQADMDDDLQFLKAACTLPLAGKNVKIDGKLYLDGGITTMVPIDRCIKGNCDHMLVVVTKDRGFIRKPNGFITQLLLDIIYRKYPILKKDFRNRTGIYNREMETVRQLEATGNVILIQPSRDCGVTRFSGKKEDLEKLYQLGIEDCENQKERLFKFLKQSS